MDIVDLTDWPVAADSGVRLLGESLPYADGAEESLLELMRATDDRSAGSDELAAAIVDWPTNYHLSVQRRNLLAPLEVRPGLRVLDVGAGTGAVTRYLADQGAEVVAIEGSLARARVAAARCRGLDSVTVASGGLGDLPDVGPFDLVVCVGVLEYALAASGGGHETADEFVRLLRRHVAPHGTVAVAIENQLGLKYLLGYPEDHLGRAWSGIEGYQGRPGVKTYSRRTLGRLLADGGLPAQRWLYPYPDYKLPETVLADAVFGQPDATDLVDQLVPTPVREFNNPRTVLCDDRAAHRTFLDAGLGPEVANSFLVLASPAADHAPVVEPGVLAWHYGHARLRRWRRSKLVLDDAGTRRVETRVPETGGPRETAWLRQEATAGTEPFVSGRTLQQQVVAACVREDLEAVTHVLRRWRQLLEGEIREVAAPPEVDHPFVTDQTRRVLDGSWLDGNLDNFLEDADGHITFFDREWHADGPVDADLVRLRALFSLAHGLVTSGAVLPWPDETTVDELTAELWATAVPDVPLDDELLEAMRDADASFQHLVTGGDLGRERLRNGRRGSTSRAGSGVPLEVPYTRLHDQLREARTTEKGRKAKVRKLRGRLEETEEQLERVTAHLAALQRQVRDLLGSRRWRMGRRLGDAYARVAPGQRTDDPETRLRRLLETGDRLLARAGRRRPADRRSRSSEEEAV